MRNGRAVAIVIKQDKLLVMFRRNEGKEYFTLPGGGIEPNESAEQATVREIEEETTLKVKVERQLYEHHYDDNSNQYFFLCKYISGQPKLSKNAPERKDSIKNVYKPMWLSLDKIKNTLLYPLEIRDWIIQDLETGFPEQVRVSYIPLSQIRHTL